MSADIGTFKGMESGMLRGIFKKAKFKGIWRGTFIKDMGNEEMDNGTGILMERDLESGGGVVSDEERLGVDED